MDFQKVEEDGSKNDTMIKVVHTGLFVSSEKIGVLLKSLANRFSQRFRVKAVSGPPQPNKTSEVHLHAVTTYTKGPNFAGAKVFLEKYLSTIKEMRPNIVIEKQAEVISLDEDEEVDSKEEDISCVVIDDSVDDESGIEIVDLETTIESRTGSFAERKMVGKSEYERNSNILNIEGDTSLAEKPSVELRADNDSQMSDKQAQNSESICGTRITQEEHVVIDLDSSEILNSQDESCSRVLTTDLLDSNSLLEKHTPVMKNSSEENVSEDHNVVEIIDDEVVVLDDSFSISTTESYSNQKDVNSKKITGPKSSISTDSENLSGTTSSAILNNDDCMVTDIVPSRGRKRKSDSQESIQSEQSEISQTKIPRHTESNPDDSSTLPKKTTKFSYKRVAHLISPLTQKVIPDSDSSSNLVQSTSGSSNIYNPNAYSGEKRTGLRPIIIDGNNVAVGHGKGTFSIKGVLLCINYFEKRGHRQIKAFLPQYRKNRDTHDLIHQMERQGTVVVTPSRKVNGKVIASYDDRYIVQYAAEVGGIIVTRDNYRDLLEEEPSWRDTIENRLLMFSWVDDMLMFPQDPMGRNGPKLEDFLKFPD